jgi:thiamine kinase-like enzyme
MLEYLFGQEWEISPAGGATGEAFVAKHEENKLFLKRNSSPFLAVLSAEGIVPKLIWTKRLENGDVITAQQWLNGRELKQSEMNHKRVASLLRKIHSSKPLATMLKRIGKTSIGPEMLLQAIEEGLDADLKERVMVSKSIEFLKNEVENIQCEEKTVCHCDVNHNNWLLTDDNQLFLIDWDGAMIADPAIDLGMLLYWYIPKQEWSNWIELYGRTLTEDLMFRMKWYVIAQTLTSIQLHKNKLRLAEMNKSLEFLDVLYES